MGGNVLLFVDIMKQFSKGDPIMFYVYAKSMKTGQESFVNTYDNAEDAIHKIAQLYKIDEKIGCLGEYYYFMKAR